MNHNSASKYEDIQDNTDSKKQSRKRRKKDEVIRSYQCPIEGCAKAYGYNDIVTL